MEYRQLGTSDLKVSVVTFGAWAIGGWMWGPQDDDDAIAAIRRSVDLGVTTIDTAAVYGFGRSEELVATAIERYRREEVQVLTKFGLRWDVNEGSNPWHTTDGQGRSVSIYCNSRPESVLHECERSLRRLKIDCIDLYQCHRRDVDTPVEETLGACAKLLRQGKVRAVGVSNFSVEEIAAAAKVVPLASNQPPYSMINRGIEKDVLPYCVEHKIGILAYSPLQRGLLTGKITLDTTFKEGDHRATDVFFRGENRRRVLGWLDKLRPIAAGHRATLAQLVINWTIRRPGITVALVGARNAVQAEENARAADWSLTGDESREINDLLEETALVME